jgi:glutamate-1-semialdehyde aminotransferase
MSVDFSWNRRSLNCIAQNALTNSKRPECFVKGIYPSHLQKGRGCFVWDHKGKRYVDFITGLGTNLIGYANDRVNQAMGTQMFFGASLSLGTHHEVECAEHVKTFFPFIDAVKFLKTGSEACSAAIRIARAHTGRNTILTDGYHGWHDQFISLTAPAIGVPPLQAIHKLIGVEAINNKVAAVIVEPVITEDSRERVEYLKDLRAQCDKVGALLIFDEVITGFRFRNHGVCNAYNITPDLICLGKAIANGMPLAAVGGKFPIMNGSEYFVSSSYAGETISLVAATTTMNLLRSKYDIEKLWVEGQKFLNAFNAMWPEGVWIEGYPTRGVFKAKDDLTKALFFQEACLAGILFGPSWFFNFPLAEEVSNIMGTLQDILVRIKTGQVELKGELPVSAFAQKMREAK